MNALRGMAVKVTAENISAADVSQEYTDLSAKLRNLENTTDQLNEIMKKAVSVTDVLSVQTQITQTEGDIEQTKARIKYLAETSAMSLITINLQQSSLVI
jgi:flagellar biosynthesis chaperone FliJ